MSYHVKRPGREQQQKAKRRTKQSLQKPNGVISPRVRKVGGEHFAIVCVDPAGRYPNRRGWLNDLDDLNAETRRLSRLSPGNRLVVGALEKLMRLWPFDSP